MVIVQILYHGTGKLEQLGLAHHLGAVPKAIIVKRIDAVNNWTVYNVGIGNTYGLYLDNNYNKVDSNAFWYDTTPTSTVFTLGDGASVNNSSGTYIAYVFAEKTGYSKFGKYVGNLSADGTFIYTGFSPSFVMTKNADINDWWGLWDNKRLGFNSSDSPRLLQPHVTDAEPTSKLIDFTSNGFKIRSSNAAINGDGNTIIYMAFAAEPLVANVGASIPATAR
jgi:hypothetical protein